MSRFTSPLRRRFMVTTLEDRLAPAAFSVVNFGDLGFGTGSAGDLRYCITQANAMAGEDTITFAIAGTIILQSELKLTGATIIDGPGPAVLTINANQKGRIFNVQTTAPVAINKLALTNGLVFNGGGAIRMDSPGGSLSVSQCVITANSGSTGSSGGAISVAAGSSLAVDQCTISGNSGLRGAGLYFYYGGSLSLTNSTLSGNMQSGSTNGGGAIYFYGTVTYEFAIRNTTISGNTASGRGGGISINQGKGTFAISNSTITGNTAFTEGGGGLAAIGAMTAVALDSTIVAQNIHANSPDIFGTAATTADSCLIGVTDGMTAFTATKSILGNQLIPFNANLGPLSNNGGLTLTHLPQPGSAARNRGTNLAGLTTDQRGLPRLAESGIDIGAVESTSAIPAAAVVPMPLITATGATPNSVQVMYTDGTAIDGSSITFGDIQILDPVGKPLTITGASVDLPGSGTPRVATYTFVPPGGSWDAADSGYYRVNMVGIQVTNTLAQPVPAGTIGSFGVSMSHSYVVNATNDEAIDTDGKLSLREAILRADAPGSPDTITFDSAVFAGTQTISLTLGAFPLLDAMSIIGPAGKATINADAKSRHFSINANGTGSKFALSNLNLVNGKVTGVTPPDRGGSVRIADESITIVNCSLLNNTAEATGGAIYTDSNLTVLTIQESVVSNNASTGVVAFNVGTGGGISIGQQSVTSIDRTTVSGNVAEGAGGGVYFYYGGQASITNSTISGNTAKGGSGGGGIYFYGNVTGTGFKITNSTISGNSAVNGPGGGLSTFLNDGLIDIANSTIVDNISNSGGGLTRTGGGAAPATFKLSSTIVARNKLNNIAQTPFDISLPAPGNITGDKNLVGVTSLANFTLTGIGNKTGTSAAPLDPLVAPLANNGGPTQTHALLSGSPAINTGNNVLGLVFDQRGAPNSRSDGGAPDIGAYEVQGDPAKVTSVVINDGDVQRSRVVSVTVNFDRVVSFVGAPTAAFLLTRKSDAVAVGLSAVVDNMGGFSAVRLTFSSGPLQGSSLQNGRYDLSVFASQFGGTGLDGNNNGLAQGSPLDDFLYFQTAAPATLDTQKIFRLLGDASGDGFVGGADFNLILAAFGGPSVAFDFNENGSTDNSDFNKFRNAFGGSI